MLYVFYINRDESPFLYEVSTFEDQMHVSISEAEFGVQLEFIESPFWRNAARLELLLSRPRFEHKSKSKSDNMICWIT